MFIGHYGVSLAAKRVVPRMSLGLLFVAVQLVDILLASFVLGGVEKLRIVPGFTRATPYDLYFVPYSHSLAGAVLWSAAAAPAYGLLVPSHPRGGRARRSGRAGRRAWSRRSSSGGAVLSHFALDFPLHVPDLPLGFSDSSAKVGLGLWNQVDVTIALELGVLVAGGALYLQATQPRGGKTAATIVVGVVLVALTIATPFVPRPADATMFAFQALGAYAALALLAEWDGPDARAGSRPLIRERRSATCSSTAPRR